MKKRLVIATALLILLSTYKLQNLILIPIFKVEEVKIDNNYILKDIEIMKNLSFLNNSSLIFLKNSSIEEKLKKLSFIESFKIKKIYPNKLKITIFEKKPIAILQHKKKKFYLSENIDLIDYQELKNYNNLPIIFGSQESFKSLYINLKKINFPINLIKKYYLYELNRWDFETYKMKIIKLPEKNYNESLKNFMILREKNNFDKYKVFDYRINNQLILK
jgi:cell division protein FtsQ|tara:strand:- start:7344 stop:8000 length:657 start_codon:yes stop_codon:yes gene_type:complete